MLTPALRPVTDTERIVTTRLCAHLDLKVTAVTSTAIYIEQDARIPGAALDGWQYFRPFVREDDAKHALAAWCTAHDRYARYETSRRHGTAWTTAGIGGSPRAIADMLSIPCELATGICYLIDLDARRA